MGIFIAKIKGNDEHLYKLVDQVENDDYANINLEEAIVYDSNNDMAHQWFKINDFSASPACLPVLTRHFESADLESLNVANNSDIDFIAFYDGACFYIQKTPKSNYIKKKQISFNGDAVSYKTDESVIFISPIPNCIYNRESDVLYFMDISKAYAVFGNLKVNYRDATNAEVVNFLSSDMVEANDFDSSKVGISNRKRIASVLNLYNNYNDEQKITLKKYIKEKVGDNIEYDENSCKFKIGDEKQLRLLLYGIQQRFYVPPLAEEGDVKVATNSTSISNLMG